MPTSSSKRKAKKTSIFKFFKNSKKKIFTIVSIFWKIYSKFEVNSELIYTK